MASDIVKGYIEKYIEKHFQSRKHTVAKLKKERDTP
jgi:hypothetical protein